jgi:hypothetical protein
MISARKFLITSLAGMLLGGFLNAQQSVSPPSTGVPRLVNFSGKASDAQGKTMAGIAGVTFAIYADQFGGVPLWMETQNVQADTKGNYSVQLGATKSEGLPLDLFTSSQARWLGVTINGGEEQPRILLLSVPYALKAADAETVGGLPASAFVLANKSQENAAATQTASTSSAGKNTVSPPTNPPVTGKGVTGFVPMWDSASDIVDSVVSQKNSLVGINTTAPAVTLDVNGKGDVRDTLTLFPKGTDPTLAISGTAFSVASTGKVTFASGQTFPRTISGVAAGIDLTGGGTSGTVTLNLDTTKVPQLIANNIFTGGQSVVGSLSVTTPTPGIHGGLGNFSSPGTGDSNSITVANGTGTTETFQSGGANAFVPGTNAGDGGLRVTPGKNIFFGDSSLSRLELDSSGNAFQPLAANGMAKALLVYDPFTGGSGSFLQCFNSTLSGAAATTPPCGFSIIQKDAGDYVFDLGFKVVNRFLAATAGLNAVPPVNSPGIVATCLNFNSGDDCASGFGVLTNNRVEVSNANSGGTFVDNIIHLIVY